MNFGQMISGVLTSLFGYTIIFALALIGKDYAPQYFDVYIYRSELVNMGMTFYLVAAVAGAIGGGFGGDVDEKGGASIGGAIMGILSGIVMVGLLVSGKI